jgi:ATP-dependent protease ClpP protease subunit
MKPMSFFFQSLVKVNPHADIGIGVELIRLSYADYGEIAVMHVCKKVRNDSCVTVKEFAEALDSLNGVKRLDLHFNLYDGSGDVATAQALYGVLADFKPKKVAYIDGVTEGVTTIIMSDEIIASHYSYFTLCEPQMLSIGDEEAMLKAAEILEAVAVSVVALYKAQCGNKITEKEIRRLMEDQIPMMADDALKKGFITAVWGKLDEEAEMFGRKD